MIDVESLPNSTTKTMKVLAPALSVLVIGLVLTIVLSEYYVQVVTSIWALAIFGLAFNLAFGFANVPSFGHAAFFGLGAYGVAATNQYLPESVLVPIGIGLLTATVFGVIVATISTRGRGIYFALLTFAFAQFLYEISVRLPELSGGETGLFIQYPDLPFGLNLTDSGTVYFASLLTLVFTILAVHRIVNSPYGRVLQAIRYNQDRAEAIGYPVQLVKISVFGLSALISSFAGILYALNNTLVTSSVLYWQNSIDVLMISIIGGSTTLLGPLAGGAFIVLLNELTKDLANVGLLVRGGLFTLIVIFFPSGIAGIASKITNYVRR